MKDSEAVRWTEVVTPQHRGQPLRVHCLPDWHSHRMRSICASADHQRRLELLLFVTCCLKIKECGLVCASPSVCLSVCLPACLPACPVTNRHRHKHLGTPWAVSSPPWKDRLIEILECRAFLGSERSIHMHVEGSRQDFDHRPSSSPSPKALLNLGI